MASTYASLPLPTLNGPGAAVDVSLIASNKTVVVSGSLNGASIVIEGSVDGGTTWAPLASFQGTETKYVNAAVLRMRTNVSGRTSVLPFSASVAVGGITITAATAINLPMPAMNGPGAAVLASALAAVKTAIVGGDFVGCSITVEASQDGGVTFAPIATFANRTGSATMPWLEAQYLRVNVQGRDSVVPFTATLDVGAAGDGGGGGLATRAFKYTATGAEASPFMVTLPGVAMPSGDYNIGYALGSVALAAELVFPDGVGERTATTFLANPTHALTAGDTIDFTLTERD